MTKKEVVSIDEAAVCATIAYGYSNKKEAAKAIMEYVGESNTKDIFPYLERRRVKREKRDEGDFFFWGKTCDRCGSKNNGIISYIWEG